MPRENPQSQPQFSYLRLLHQQFPPSFLHPSVTLLRRLRPMRRRCFLLVLAAAVLLAGFSFAKHGDYRFATDEFSLTSSDQDGTSSSTVRTEDVDDTTSDKTETGSLADEGISVQMPEEQQEQRTEDDSLDASSTTTDNKDTATLSAAEHDVRELKPPNRVGDSKRILVTGGAGFIGSHLVDRLMEEGHSVIVLDNLFTGRKSNLAAHFSSPRFEFIRHDVTEPISLEVDQIYHLACPASPVHYKYNPVKTIKTSFMGTYNMLGLAKRTSARFLLTSTSEVYGDPLEHPQRESYWGNVNPIGERSCYDEGKRVAETLTMDFHRQDRVDVRVARIFNTYGPRMALNDGRVVSNFVGQALRGEKLTIQGNGSQTRSFCYVADMVDGLMKLMNADEVDGPVNVGNPGEFTIEELAHVVKSVVSSKTELSYVPNTPDDPRQRKPDISKAKRVLDWEPKVQLKDGLKHMAEDFEKRVNGKVENW